MPVAPQSLANLKRGGSPGRAPGTPNKLTADHRAAILEAATTGEVDGLVGYYVGLKLNLPDKFADHVKALLPRDISLTADVSVTHAATSALASAFPPELVALAQLDWRAMEPGARDALAAGLAELMARAAGGATMIDVTAQTEGESGAT